MSSATLFSPAKVNLFLAITDRRKDGFHNLVSLVVSLDWGDTLHAELAEETRLICDDDELPVDQSNLVLKALAAFRESTGWTAGVKLQLVKRIPVGAGLGGGSSNAVVTLRAVNALSGNLLADDELAKIATKLGADCALFLQNAPVVMRGIGDQIETLDNKTLQRISGQSILLFKPPFGVSTPWAYGQMAARPETYLPSDQAESRWNQWQKGESTDLSDLGYNSMESVVFGKYPAIPALFRLIREKFGLLPLMSGSGSASFVFLEKDTPVDEVTALIQEMWGDASFVTIAGLA
ncbi:MAG: 4-(cytidine 5'-diphospho)-2-C-methyl-D-erythritol kinase [Opitutaceae bacterium]|nr:4-(cytidine 5'-diphospho)-2-C-methyl-D-erythritol kinase [Opitutaceae bacterium]